VREEKGGIFCEQVPLQRIEQETLDYFYSYDILYIQYIIWRNQ